MEALIYITKNIDKLFENCEYPSYNNQTLKFVQPKLENDESIIVLNQILNIVLTDKLYSTSLTQLNVKTLQHLINLKCNEICNNKYKISFVSSNQNAIDTFTADFYNYLNSLC
jgi:hypothetical protein